MSRNNSKHRKKAKLGRERDTEQHAGQINISKNDTELCSFSKYTPPYFQFVLFI